TSASILSPTSPSALPLQFDVSLKKDLVAEPQNGRLFVILSHTNNPEPRLTLGRTGPDAPPALARDVKGFASGSTAVLDQSAFAFPITNLAELPAGDYFVQALLDS